jgi:hypothetical protein
MAVSSCTIILQELYTLQLEDVTRAPEFAPWTHFPRHQTSRLLLQNYLPGVA